MIIRTGAPANPLIAALDTSDLPHLERLASSLGPHVGLLKVGLEAFASHGPQAVTVAAAHAPVFCDLKLHDIPTTVERAAAAVARLEVAMLTVHAAGGPQMIQAAVRGAPDLAVLAVTVLTSLDDDVQGELGHPPVAEQVPRLAVLAVEAGAKGVVCAPSDIVPVRNAVGPDTLIVTPGVRSEGTAADDQARVATPHSALAAGADYLVVGRPLTQATNPGVAAAHLLHDVQAY